MGFGDLDLAREGGKFGSGCNRKGGLVTEKNWPRRYRVGMIRKADNWVTGVWERDNWECGCCGKSGC